MRRFEYRAVTCPREKLDISALNDLGADGWELVWLDAKGDDLLLTLKREIILDDCVLPPFVKNFELAKE